MGAEASNLPRCEGTPWSHLGSSPRRCTLLRTGIRLAIDPRVPGRVLTPQGRFAGRPWSVTCHFSRPAPRLRAFLDPVAAVLDGDLWSGHWPYHHGYAWP